METYLAIDRIGCRDDATPGIQCSMNARLRNSHSLLFHDFVQHGAGGFGHFVELVNAAYTSIRENEGTGFEN